jgi:glycosyltransferase involved in cell wall biosynthesis
MNKTGFIYFVSRNSETVASYRFRVRKLVPALMEAGLRVREFQLAMGTAWKIAIHAAVDRQRDPSAKWFVVFQKCEAPVLASVLKLLGAKIIVDIDDYPASRISGLALPARKVDRTRWWLRRADWVVAGSQALEDWVAEASTRHSVIPTCLDTLTYAHLVPVPNRSPVVIGWIGSGSIDDYFRETMDGVIAALEATGSRLLLVGDCPPERVVHPAIEFRRWEPCLEPLIFAEFDIGIMPLPDNDRARMKAGFKLIQYMAAGLPVVASPVGVNQEIVQHGARGFLASSPEDWRLHLTALASNSSARLIHGNRGREYVCKRYDISVAASAWLRLTQQLGAPHDASRLP